MSAPTLIFFYSWKWTSGLIIFWINRAASLSTTILSLILFLVSSCLSLTHVYHRLYIQTHLSKIGQCTWLVPVHQINLWERRIEPVIHGRLLQGMIILHDHSGCGAQALHLFAARTRMNVFRKMWHISPKVALWYMTHTAMDNQFNIFGITFIRFVELFL